MQMYFYFAGYNPGSFNMTREIPVETEKLVTTGNFLIFPVPTRERLFITNQDSFSEYVILNVFGQVLLTGIPDNNPIDVSQLCSGNYFIRLVGKTQIETAKFMKI